MHRGRGEISLFLVLGMLLFFLLLSLQGCDRVKEDLTTDDLEVVGEATLNVKVRTFGEAKILHVYLEAVDGIEDASTFTLYNEKDLLGEERPIGERSIHYTFGNAITLLLFDSSNHLLAQGTVEAQDFSGSIVLLSPERASLHMEAFHSLTSESPMILAVSRVRFGDYT